MYAAVRVRGTVGLEKDVADTMKMLKLTRINHCVLLAKNKSTEGMLKKARFYITWGDIDNKTLEKLISKRGRLKGNKHLDDRSIKDIYLKITKEGSIKTLKDIIPVFRLSPPKKGYKNIRSFYPKGDLGDRKEKINELLKGMM